VIDDVVEDISGGSFDAINDDRFVRYSMAITDDDPESQVEKASMSRCGRM
jgi:hypothetical protein